MILDDCASGSAVWLFVPSRASSLRLHIIINIITVVVVMIVADRIVMRKNLTMEGRHQNQNHQQKQWQWQQNLPRQRLLWGWRRRKKNPSSENKYVVQLQKELPALWSQSDVQRWGQEKCVVPLLSVLPCSFILGGEEYKFWETNTFFCPSPSFCRSIAHHPFRLGKAELTYFPLLRSFVCSLVILVLCHLKGPHL